jgi:hypothetical protein
MVACLSLWTTGFKLSPLAHTLDKPFDVALGVFQMADATTAYYIARDQLNPKGREGK